MSGEEEGMGEGGVGEGFSGSVDATFLQCIFSLFFSFSFILFLSISLSLTTTKEKKNNSKKQNNACTRTPKFLTTILSSRWGVVLGPPPQLGTNAWTEGATKGP